MANTGTDSAIRTRIDSFLSELSGLVRKAAMESVEELLSGGATPRRRRGPGRPKGSGRRGPGRPPNAARPGRPARASKRIRRSAADLEKIAVRVLAYVRSNAGQRLEQIGKALEVETAVLKRPVANLLAAKKLRTTGQKRGTMYFAGGGGGGARKATARRPAKRARKSKARGRRPAKRARKAKAKVRRPARRARKASPKRSARRAAPRIARRAPAHKKRPARKRSHKAPISNARAVATELAMDAAAMSTALP